MKDYEKKQIQITVKTAKRLDILKANFWLKNNVKPNNDTILEQLIEAEITRLGLESEKTTL